MNVSKVFVYAMEGVRKSLRLGESFVYSMRASSKKFKIARCDSSNPNLV